MKEDSKKQKRSEKDKNKGGNKKNNIAKFLPILTIVLALIAGILIYISFTTNKNEEKTLAYTDLVKEVANGNIEKVEMELGSASAKVKVKNVEEEKKTVIPNTESFIELIQDKVAEGNEIELIQKPRNVFESISSVVFSLLPTAIMVILLVMIIKMQGLGDKGKVYDDTERK